MLVSLGITVPFDIVEGYFRTNAKIAGALYAYHTIRVPILRELIEMETQIENAALPPAQGLRYNLYRYSLEQIKAFTFSITAGLHQSIANSPALTLFSIFQNSDEIAERHAAIADGSVRKSKIELLQYGAVKTDAETILKESINMEVSKDQNGIGQ
jgi:hypothetical protein